MQQPRRKWSDWSECSSQCKKTRHRLYCDDILAQTKRSTSRPESSTVRREPPDSIGGSGRQLKFDPARRLSNEDETRGRVKRELSLPQKQATGALATESDDQPEEEDYADQGDEEGEMDSCDHVEPSRTYQEISCFTGQCRLTAGLEPPGRGGARRDQVSGRPLASDSSDKDFSNASQSRKPVQWASGTLRFSNPSIKEPLDRHNGLQQPVSPHQVNVRPQGQWNGSVPEVVEAGNAVSGDVALGPQSGTTTRGWTQTMWPRQLLSGGLGGFAQASNLIQWTILIGALLGIILLLMLILRKLLACFSSNSKYRWMLAKQTITSSSSSLDCRRRVLSGKLFQGSALVSSSNAPQSYLAGDAPTSALNRLQFGLKQSCAGDAGCRPPTGTYTHLVDSLGQPHLCSSGQTEFNTDQLLDYGNQIALEAHTKYGCYCCPAPSASLHGACNHNPGCPALRGPAQGGYNAHQQALVRVHATPDKRSYHLSKEDFVPTFADADPKLANQSSASHHKQEPLEPAPPVACLGGEKRAAEPRRMASSKQSKHKSPGVPGSARKSQKMAPDEIDLNAGSPTPPHSSSCSSITAETSSVQSTTAQLLSHGASSSFEQGADLLADYADTQPGSQALAASVSASPAISLHGQPARVVRGSTAKLVALHNTAQSQPNSPMFVNQFIGRQSNRYQRVYSNERSTGNPLNSARNRSMSHDNNAHPSEPEYAEPVQLAQNTCDDKQQT